LSETTGDAGGESRNTAQAAASAATLSKVDLAGSVGIGASFMAPLP
jgi:hypothetical protein